MNLTFDPVFRSHAQKAKARQFGDFMNHVRDIRNSSDQRERAKYIAVRDGMIRELGASMQNGRLVFNGIQPGSVHSNQFLTNLSVKYANEAYIADLIAPVVTVSKRADTYATYDERQILNAPPAETGPEGDVNEVARGRGSANYSVKDYALKDKISQETLDNQDQVFDELADMVADLTDQLMLLREQRVSATVLASGSYPSGHTANAAVKWDQATSSVVADILTARSTLWRGSGRTKVVGVCGIAVWNVMAQSAVLRDLFKAVREGLATPAAIAQYFRLDDIYVGEARQETANIGQTASYSRIWATDNFAVLAVAENPTRRSAHFMSTFQVGQRQLTTWIDPSKGPGSGVIYNKIGHSLDEKIVANKSGYLITDVIT